MGKFTMFIIIFTKVSHFLVNQKEQSVKQRNWVVVLILINQYAEMAQSHKKFFLYILKTQEYVVQLWQRGISCKNLFLPKTRSHTGNLQTKSRV